MTVDNAIRFGLDHVGAMLEAVEALKDTVDYEFFAKSVEQTSDSPYINVTETFAEAFDSLLNTSASVGDAFTPWLTSHEAYLAGVSTYLTQKNWSIPTKVANLLRKRGFSVPNNLSVHTGLFSGYNYDGATLAAIPYPAVPLTLQASRPESIIRAQTLGSIGGTNLQLSITAVRAVGTTYTWALTIPSATSKGSVFSLLTSVTGSISGNTVTVNVNPSTFGLTANQWFVIRNNSTLGYLEGIKCQALYATAIAANGLNWDITVSTTPVEPSSYTSFYVEPCFNRVTTVSRVGGGTSGDKFKLLYAPDRALPSTSFIPS